MHRISRIFCTKDSKKFNSEYGPDIHNERLEILEFLYLVEKLLVEIFQNSFIMTVKVKAAVVTTVKKKMKIQKILSKKSIIFYIFYFKAK